MTAGKRKSRTGSVPANLAGSILAVGAAFALVGAATAQADYVTIGDPGKAADTADGDNATSGIQRYGAVDYTYQISATEVTIAEFQQATGAGDGSEKDVSYWSDDVGPSAPASNVSLYEAMKYCNWLTSDDINNGAYNFSGGVYQSTDRDSAISTYGTIYALPTEDEWYKAAYYTGSGYSDYANGDDVGNVPTKSPDGSTGWNYDDALDPSQVWTVDKGTAEQNETVNMMGNVYEWVGDPNGVLRGGSYNRSASYLARSINYDLSPNSEYADVGFRIVEVVPEPGSITLLLVCTAGLIARQRIYGAFMRK